MRIARAARTATGAALVLALAIWLPLNHMVEETGMVDAATLDSGDRGMAARGNGSVGQRAQGTDDWVPVADRTSNCRGEITRTASSDVVQICDTVTMTVKIEPECPFCPGGINVVFVQPGLTEEPAWMIQEALDSVRTLSRLAKSEALDRNELRAGVVHYSSRDGNAPKVVLPLTTAIDSASRYLDFALGGRLHIGPATEAARMAAKMIEQARREHAPQQRDKDASTGCDHLVFFTSQMKGLDYLEQVPLFCNGANVTLSVGCPSGVSRWCEVPKRLPRSSAYYSQYNQHGKMADQLAADISALAEANRPRELSLVQHLPAGLAYVDRSANEPPTSVVTDTTTGETTLAWEWPRIGSASPPTITYRVKPRAEGTWRIAGGTTVIDMSNRSRDTVMASQLITVSGLCLPPTATPSATLTPPSTSTPTATSSPTSPPTVTTSPTATSTRPSPPTATRLPAAVYLPIVRSDSCREQWIYSDVVLVVDMSTSMSQPVTSGRTKLAATLDATKAFLDLMDFTPNRAGHNDQVALVGFNHSAWLESSLASDPVAVRAALDRLPAKQAAGTRLDLAFTTGQAALATAAHRPGNMPVLLLLTDGLPSEVPPGPDGRPATTVLAAAQVAKDAGTKVYAIGVGLPDSIDEDLLRAAATSSRHYFFTPDPEHLLTIYREIAYSFGCSMDQRQ